MFEVVLSQSILRSATQNLFYDCWLHAFSRKSSSCKGLCNSMIYTFVLSQTIALYDLKIDSQILQVCEPPTRCFAKNRRDGNIYWVLYVTLNSQCNVVKSLKGLKKNRRNSKQSTAIESRVCKSSESQICKGVIFKMRRRISRTCNKHKRCESVHPPILLFWYSFHIMHSIHDTQRAY